MIEVMKPVKRTVSNSTCFSLKLLDCFRDVISKYIYIYGYIYMYVHTYM
jgi:hypothetical protein